MTVTKHPMKYKELVDEEGYPLYIKRLRYRGRTFDLETREAKGKYNFELTEIYGEHEDEGAGRWAASYGYPYDSAETAFRAATETIQERIDLERDGWESLK